MKAVCGTGRKATNEEIEELKATALKEHVHLGLDEVPEVVIEARVRNLATERGLILPGAPGPGGDPHKPGRDRDPDYLRASLEQKAQKCAKDRRHAKLKKHIRIVRENTDRFYLFCFLKGGFAQELSKCRALEVLTALIEQLCGDVETWISIETLAERLGRTPKTVSKALQKLEEKRIITLTDAADRYYSLNGKRIAKNQGYVIRLHPPMFWDWRSIGGVPECMRKYLAAYEDEDVDM